MMDKLINNHGGLHNRLTNRIFLQPFDLQESEFFLKAKGFDLSRYEISACYMILGGIPFYLSLLDSQRSLAQNIDSLLFSPNGALFNEFDKDYDCNLKMQQFFGFIKKMFKFVAIFGIKDICMSK